MSKPNELKDLNSTESFMKFIENAIEGFNKNVRKQIVDEEEANRKTAGINIIYETLKQLVATDQEINANNKMTAAIGTLLTLALYDTPAFEEGVAILNHVMKERLFSKVQEMTGSSTISQGNKTKQ